MGLMFMGMVKDAKRTSIGPGYICLQNFLRKSFKSSSNSPITVLLGGKEGGGGEHEQKHERVLSTTQRTVARDSSVSVQGCMNSPVLFS
jgi:hypothetical protein